MASGNARNRLQVLINLRNSKLFFLQVPCCEVACAMVAHPSLASLHAATFAHTLKTLTNLITAFCAAFSCGNTLSVGARTLCFATTLCSLLKVAILPLRRKFSQEGESKNKKCWSSFHRHSAHISSFRQWWKQRDWQARILLHRMKHALARPLRGNDFRVVLALCECECCHLLLIDLT